MKVICFHNPEEENGFLSNWYISNFSVNDMNFTSVEQFMMYQKAVYFGDNRTAEKIIITQDVAYIKELGRSVTGYNDSIWNGIRQIIVYEGLLAKFSQDDFLCGKLRETGRAVFAECAVKDRIWGIGRSMNDPKRMFPEQWKGQNLSGFALMMVRDRM